jgi:hypothetical protein
MKRIKVLSAGKNPETNLSDACFIESTRRFVAIELSLLASKIWALKVLVKGWRATISPSDPPGRKLVTVWLSILGDETCNARGRAVSIWQSADAG